MGERKIGRETGVVQRERDEKRDRSGKERRIAVGENEREGWDRERRKIERESRVGEKE